MSILIRKKAHRDILKENEVQKNVQLTQRNEKRFLDKDTFCVELIMLSKLNLLVGDRLLQQDLFNLDLSADISRKFLNFLITNDLITDAELRKLNAKKAKFHLPDKTVRVYAFFGHLRNHFEYFLVNNYFPLYLCQYIINEFSKCYVHKSNVDKINPLSLVESNEGKIVKESSWLRSRALFTLCSCVVTNPERFNIDKNSNDYAELYLTFSHDWVEFSQGCVTRSKRERSKEANEYNFVKEA